MSKMFSIYSQWFRSSGTATNGQFIDFFIALFFYRLWKWFCFESEAFYLGSKLELITNLNNKTIEYRFFWWLIARNAYVKYASLSFFSVASINSIRPRVKKASSKWLIRSVVKAMYDMIIQSRNGRLIGILNSESWTMWLFDIAIWLKPD